MAAKAAVVLGHESGDQYAKEREAREIAHLKQKITAMKLKVHDWELKGVQNDASVASMWSELFTYHRLANCLLAYLPTDDDSDSLQRSVFQLLAEVELDVQALQPTVPELVAFSSTLHPLHQSEVKEALSNDTGDVDSLTRLTNHITTRRPGQLGMDLTEATATELVKVEDFIRTMLMRRPESELVAQLSLVRCQAFEWQSWGLLNHGDRWSGLPVDLPAPLSHLPAPASFSHEKDSPNFADSLRRRFTASPAAAPAAVPATALTLPPPAAIRVHQRGGGQASGRG
jgi:hypothetical protein